MASNDNSNSYVQQMSGLAGTFASYLRMPLLVSSGVAALLSSALYFKQKALIYPSHIPDLSRTDVPRPSQFGLTDFEDLMIPTPDGEHLSAFYIRAPKGYRSQKKLTILMFHGNAGNIGHRVPIARMFVQQMGCSVFMLEYRGYGLSTGSPDEAGIMIDAQTAFDYLRNRAETRDNDIAIFGQSLGGAVSVQLVAKNQNDEKLVGLVLENTFLSMRQLIPRAEHMRRLYEMSQSPTKIWKALPNGDHNSSILEEGYFESIGEFLASLGGKASLNEKARTKRRANYEMVDS